MFVSARLTLFLAISSFVACAPSLDAIAAQRDEICKDPALTRQEKTTCQEQMAAAQSATELKEIQARVRERIASRKKK